jgi:hypothetical protein
MILLSIVFSEQTMMMMVLYVDMTNAKKAKVNLMQNAPPVSEGSRSYYVQLADNCPRPSH